MEQPSELTVAGNDRVALEHELIELAELLVDKGAITAEAFAKLRELQVTAAGLKAPLKLVPEQA